MSPEEGSGEPVFRVLKGNPTDEELAAVVTVLSRLALRAEPADPPPTSGWSAYWRSLRAPVGPGPQAWRLSGRI